MTAKPATKKKPTQAIEHAIEKGNKVLPDNEKIPHWFPYQLRHSAGTDAEKANGLDCAQALLGHKTANVTKRYALREVFGRCFTFSLQREHIETRRSY